ncbi:MAG: NAD(P)/FAD-dependent oxidoreductase, partial [Actinomycetospora chiangmaiensis]|nr:NAD(P)/FAD-dependent oxidoreductase [Actinomycetospora chiangmaiensis]
TPTLPHDHVVLSENIAPTAVDAFAQAGIGPVRRLSHAVSPQEAAGLAPVAIGLLREAGQGAALPPEPAALTRLVKAAPLTLTGMMGLDRAISTAGGVVLDALDERAMLRARPGLFLAGEMLDWEAPTGGYLLQGAIAGGRAAADGMLDWLCTRQGLAQNPTIPVAPAGQDAPSPS